MRALMITVTAAKKKAAAKAISQSKEVKYGRRSPAAAGRTGGAVHTEGWFQPGDDRRHARRVGPDARAQDRPGDAGAAPRRRRLGERGGGGQAGERPGAQNGWAAAFGLRRG